MSSTHIYHVTTTNACGLTSTRVYNLADTELYSFQPIVGSTGCGASEKMSISGDLRNETFWQYPVTAVVKNSNGDIVGTQTLNTSNDNYNFTNLPLADYNITLTDACGGTLTKVAINPQNSGNPSVSLYATSTWRCNTGLPPQVQTGTTTAEIIISGYFPDQANAIVKIIAGPSHVGVNGILLDGRTWAWSNLLPGTYTIEYTSCGTTHTGTFTISPTNGGILKQSFTAKAATQCGGTGNISSQYTYNGSYPYVFQLLDGSGAQIATSTTGNFSNLPAGSYTVRMKVDPYCGSGQFAYYVDQPVNVIIVPVNNGAVVTSSVGIICESATGVPLSSGSAYIDIAGAGPFTVTYATSQTGPWTTINNVGNNLVIDNLAANTLYYLEITDNCGIKKSQTIQVQTMGSLNASNTVHPCNNQPYELTIPYYSGATYEWVNPQGVVVSNSRTYSIANFDPSYNGTYVAKISWGNCVTRYVNITVNSNQCGQPIENVCYRDAGTTNPILDSKHGITALGRAGVNNGNWPMVRKGAHTVLESKTKGFVVNRLTTSQKNALIPVLGMAVYDTDLDCLSIYDGTTWKCYRSQACPD